MENIWSGQFDINAYGTSVQYDKSTDKWYAYYEFVLPSHIVASLKQSPQTLSLKFSAISGNRGSFTLHQLKFTDKESEDNRVLTNELQTIANDTAKNPQGLTAEQIKNLSCKYVISFDSSFYACRNLNLFSIYHRDMQDPNDGNKTKRFYYQIGQDVDAPMLFVEWWVFAPGYDPQVP